MAKSADLAAPDSLRPAEVLRSFGDFIAGLGTQPVTLPLREIVLEMIGSYQTLAQGLQPFSWAKGDDELYAIVEEFVRSAEIFFFPERRQPVLEVAFSVQKWHLDNLDIEFLVTWNPALPNFEALINVVEEGREFCSSSDPPRIVNYC